MGEKVGASGLLTDGKGHPEHDRAGECRAREAWPRLEPQEIKGHEGEAGSGVRSRKAGRAWQPFGPALEEVHVGMCAAEASEVPWAVHVGRELQQVDNRRAKGERDHDVGGRFPVPAKPRDPEAAGEDSDRCKPDGRHQAGPDIVNPCLRPPATGANPGHGHPVEENGHCDAPVEVEGMDRHRGDEEERCRKPEVRELEGDRT